MELKCLSCIVQQMQFAVQQALGNHQGEELPVVNDAITLAPAWQQKMVGMQMVMACISVPVCGTHLEVAEVPPEQQALLGGKLLAGRIDGIE
jgi:hypothetical protein